MHAVGDRGIHPPSQCDPPPPPPVSVPFLPPFSSMYKSYDYRAVHIGFGPVVNPACQPCRVWDDHRTRFVTSRALSTPGVATCIAGFLDCSPLRAVSQCLQPLTRDTRAALTPVTLHPVWRSVWQRSGWAFCEATCPPRSWTALALRCASARDDGVVVVSPSGRVLVPGGPVDARGDRVTLLLDTGPVFQYRGRTFPVLEFGCCHP